MGGRGKETVTRTNPAATLTVDKLWDTPFKKTGNGVWELNLGDWGGAQILDEEGSSRAIRQGFMPGQRVYSITIWVGDSGPMNLGIMTERLNDAKTTAKEALQRELESAVRNPDLSPRTGGRRRNR